MYAEYAVAWIQESDMEFPGANASDYSSLSPAAVTRLTMRPWVTSQHFHHDGVDSLIARQTSAALMLKPI